MPGRKLEARVRQHQPRIAIIELHGEINSAAEADLNAAYAEAAQDAPDVILLNFGDVDYINSTGIALIVALLGQARAAQRTLLACDLNEHYIEIFRITRLVDFMQIYPDEASALSSQSVGNT